MVDLESVASLREPRADKAGDVPRARCPDGGGCCVVIDKGLPEGVSEEGLLHCASLRRRTRAEIQLRLTSFPAEECFPHRPLGPFHNPPR
jgi:hypothetical protein